MKMRDCAYIEDKLCAYIDNAIMYMCSPEQKLFSLGRFNQIINDFKSVHTFVKKIHKQHTRETNYGSIDVCVKFREVNLNGFGDMFQTAFFLMKFCLGRFTAKNIL